ncbi:MAG: hypothetical protein JNL02_14405 [Saprospiraceae bacterium]|nr:hypothetical protein [Saprospiraceae bacterium]
MKIIAVNGAKERNKSPAPPAGAIFLGQIHHLSSKPAKVSTICIDKIGFIFAPENGGLRSCKGKNGVILPSGCCVKPETQDLSNHAPYIICFTAPVGCLPAKPCI